jgi:hypothetical protein
MNAALLLLALLTAPTASEGNAFRLQLTVTSDLPAGRVPMDPMIDFAAVIAKAGLPGVLDPNSIEVIDLATNKPVPVLRSEEFAYGDQGRVQWVIDDPGHKRFEIRFRTAETRPPMAPQRDVPMVGTGDLLRYNAGKPRPITLPFPGRLVDLTGDGKADLVGCWNYAHRPGWPWDGIVCYPRVGDPAKFEFGELVRLRYVTAPDSTDFQHFRNIYMYSDVADLDGDGLPDVVYCPANQDQLHFYRNSGRRDASGMPVFVAAGSVPRQTRDWQPCRAVDLDGDKLVDFVVGNLWRRNTKGWPVELAPAVKLDAGREPCFYDVDGDGRLDAVCLADGPAEEPRAWHIAWRKNLGGSPPSFAPEEPLSDIDDFWCTAVAPVVDGSRRGLLVQHDVYRMVSFYQQTDAVDGKPRFQRVGPAVSESAVVALSDQCWPCVCDWDADGDMDLLTGSGYGWPMIVLNEGTKEKMALGEPQWILSEGKPIRLIRNEILPGKYWHNMGYLYPVFTDWDVDGLPDLVVPNETNRIFWYKNQGTLQAPVFGPRQQVLCDGYADGPEQLAVSAKRVTDENPYPLEPDQPFFWRVGAAVADFTGDGLPDLITHDGATRKATLFVQYRDPEGKLRLKKDHALVLPDGRLLDYSVVGRPDLWCESFRTADWDGDGLLDLIYSCSGGSSQATIYLLKNVGSRTEPKFDMPRELRCFGESIKVTAHGPHPWVGDVDGDGLPDVLTCVEWSVYPLFTHNALEMAERPKYELSEVGVKP